VDGVSVVVLVVVCRGVVVDGKGAVQSISRIPVREPDPRILNGTENVNTLSSNTYENTRHENFGQRKDSQQDMNQKYKAHIIKHEQLSQKGNDRFNGLYEDRH
jgi:hypothetical protein